MNILIDDVPARAKRTNIFSQFSSRHDAKPGIHPILACLNGEIKIADEAASVGQFATTVAVRPITFSTSK
jgi:hypothetical protein